MVKFLVLWVQCSRRNSISKTVKFLAGKRANEDIHSLYNFEFLNPRRTESIQYIELKFLEKFVHAMHFQYLEMIFL